MMEIFFAAQPGGKQQKLFQKQWGSWMNVGWK